MSGLFRMGADAHIGPSKPVYSAHLSSILRSCRCFCSFKEVSSNETTIHSSHMPNELIQILSTVH